MTDSQAKPHPELHERIERVRDQLGGHAGLEAMLETAAHRPHQTIVDPVQLHPELVIAPNSPAAQEIIARHAERTAWMAEIYRQNVGNAAS